MSRSGPCNPRGFTLVELMLGLAVSAIVAAAAGGMLVAAADVFRSADSSQSAAMTAERVVARLAGSLASCRRVGAVTNPASGFTMSYWAADTNADGVPQLSEMTVVRWLSADRTLKLYKQVGLSAAADVTVSKSQMDDSAWPATFLALSTCQTLPVATTTADAQISSLSVTVRKAHGLANTVSLTGVVKSGQRSVNFYQTITLHCSVEY
jgi:prepilin-type N-terminal cleavage/methylation domain-containing protein